MKVMKALMKIYEEGVKGPSENVKCQNPNSK
jgi:hypothetical protein